MKLKKLKNRIYLENFISLTYQIAILSFFFLFHLIVFPLWRFNLIIFVIHIFT